MIKLRSFTLRNRRLVASSLSVVWLSAISLALISPLAAQSVLFIPGSTEPRLQLTGEHYQLDVNGVYFNALTPGRTVSQYGVLGTDLGFPVVYPDKIIFLFGDTMSAYSEPSSSGPRYFLGRGGDDSIGYIPNVDLDKCHQIKRTEEQLAIGNPRPTVDAGDCPAIRFHTNPSHGPREHIFKAITISGLRPGDGTAEFMTPSGAIDYNDRLYMFYKVRIQQAEPHFALETIMARSDQSPRSWSDATPPTFTRLYTVSSHAVVADVNNLPTESSGGGKFMFDPPVVMDSGTMAINGLASGLPPALQGVPKVVFVFGSSWRYNRSNLYLAAFNLSDIEAGPSRWFYYAGRNAAGNLWSSDETAAAPLLDGAPNVGNHTVIWNDALRRFVLMHGNIVMRSSTTPWGPWSEPVVIFGPRSEWASKLIHRPGMDRITRTVLPIINPATGRETDLNGDETGVPYGPNLIDKYTRNSDGSVTLFYTMSTWNPYQVFLVSSRFTLGPVQRPIVSSASYDGNSVSPASIVTLLGQDLTRVTEAAKSPTDLPRSLGGINVTVQDSAGVSQPAALYYVSPTQVNFVLPAETVPGPTTVSVFSASGLVYSTVTQVSLLAPALFSANANGSGPAAAFLVTIGSDGARRSQPIFSCGNAPGSCTTNRLDLTSFGSDARLELYGTGLRNVAGTRSVTALIGGVAAPVLYAGTQSQYPGMDQVVVSVPPELRGRGEVELVLLVDGKSTNSLRIAFA
jgi:uncharacterized protein (TIGR03437 family)